MRSRIQNYGFVYNGQPDPTRPISLTLTQTPQPQLTAWFQLIAGTKKAGKKINPGRWKSKVEKIPTTDQQLDSTLFFLRTWDFMSFISFLFLVLSYHLLSSTVSSVKTAIPSGKGTRGHSHGDQHLQAPRMHETLFPARRDHP